jgi:hypothetical protein
MDLAKDRELLTAKIIQLAPIAGNVVADEAPGVLAGAGQGIQSARRGGQLGRDAAVAFRITQEVQVFGLHSGVSSFLKDTGSELCGL